MPIPLTVRSYLAENQISFDVIAHRHSASSLNTASEAHILPARLAKAVLLEDEREPNRFLMAVVPATTSTSCTWRRRSFSGCSASASTGSSASRCSLSE